MSRYANMYTGVLQVIPTPMTMLEWHEYTGNEHPAPDTPGYMLEVMGDEVDISYPHHPDHHGRISWVTAEYFEETYFRTKFEPEEFDNMSVPELATALKNLKDRLEQCGTLKTQVQKSYDFLSMDVLPDRMDEEGIQTLKIKNVGRLQVASDIRCAVPAKNKDKVKDWLKENGHGSMVSETINASTLRAFVKEMMEENKGYPEDLLNITPYSRATVVKA